MSWVLVALVLEILGAAWIIFRLSSRLARQLPEIESRAEKRAAARISAQISHDLRSPLAALEMISFDEQGQMVRNAVGRIRDIANGLVGRNLESTSELSSGASVQLLSVLIEDLLSEKRTQYRSRIGLEIEGRLGAASYGLFVSVATAPFAHELSELLDRSIAAGSHRGRFALCLSTDGNQHTIELLHNETLIPAAHMHLPRAKPPQWFLPELRLMPDQTVVVLDDDVSTHQIWESRLATLGVAGSAIELLHFTTGADFSNWVSENSRSALYLCDFELLGERENGLEVIDRLGIAASAVLVTSRFAEPAVREHARRLGIKLVPKSTLVYVPITISASPPVDAILIDDDALVRALWSTDARKRGKHLSTFSSAEEFLKKSDAFDRAATVYVDSNLGGEISGEELAREMNALGFSNIHLATGYEPDSFPEMSWIRSVVGKEPAW